MFEAAEVLQIFVTADERHGDRRLYEALFDACFEHNVAGVTVIRNVEGFDDSPTIVHERWFRHDEPVALIIVDRHDTIDRLVATITPWIVHGIVIRSDAKVRRVEQTDGSRS